MGVLAPDVSPRPPGSTRLCTDTQMMRLCANTAIADALAAAATDEQTGDKMFCWEMLWASPCEQGMDCQATHAGAEHKTSAMWLTAGKQQRYAIQSDPDQKINISPNKIIYQASRLRSKACFVFAGPIPQHKYLTGHAHLKGLL